MESLKSNAVDLIFAGPPYNIKKAGWDVFDFLKDYLDWMIEWVREAQRVLTKHGSLYICGFPEILADIKYEWEPNPKSHIKRIRLAKDEEESHKRRKNLRMK